MSRGPCIRAVKVGDQERIELELDGTLTATDAMNLALELQAFSILVGRRNLARRERASKRLHTSARRAPRSTT